MTTQPVPPHRSHTLAEEPSSPRRRMPQPWGRQAALNLGLLLLAAGAVAGKQLLLHFHAYTSMGGECQTPPVTKLKLTDIYLTGSGNGTIVQRVEWDGIDGSTLTVFRSPTGWSGTITDNGQGHFTLIDTAGVTPGTRYTYSVQQTEPPPPPPPYPYVACTPTISVATTMADTPEQSIVTDDQSVDARYDPRYATWTYLNHNFGVTAYRGGLYAGYNADNSEVGHAYLKFFIPNVQSGWPGIGSVNAYYTRSYATGATTVACQTVGTNWTGSVLTWSTAPSFTPSNATTAQQASVTYDGTPTSQTWTHWEMGPDLLAAMQAGSGVYAAALGGYSEPSTSTNPIGGQATGWAYFAKKDSLAHEPACVLYAN